MPAFERCSTGGANLSYHREKVRDWVSEAIQAEGEDVIEDARPSCLDQTASMDTHLLAQAQVKGQYHST